MCHDVVEVISRDEAIVIEVGLGEHYINLLFGHVLSKILGHFLELRGSYFALY